MGFLAYIDIFLVIVFILINVFDENLWGSKYSEDSSAGCQLTLMLLAILLIGVGINVFNICAITNNKVKIEMYNKQIAINDQRVEKLLPAITNKLDGYSVYEKQVITDVFKDKGSLAVFPPNLKNDALVLAAAESIKEIKGQTFEIQDEITKCEYNIDSKKRTMYWYSIWVPKN